eukprot:6102541-Pyramimonas_sp.AAC.1
MHCHPRRAVTRHASISARANPWRAKAAPRNGPPARSCHVLRPSLRGRRALAGAGTGPRAPWQD